MSKVFLAYKSTDRERASVVRAKLEALDVPLFISPSMASGENYIRAINEQLNSASVVLVLWTEAAVRISAGEPNFLLSEAQRGYARGILVAATFEKIALDHLPVPFNLIQAPDLSDWIQSGASAKHAGWQRVLDALGRRLNRPGLARLAIALESNDDELKKEFLRGYPEDPYAHKAAYLWDAERETPEERKVASPNASQTRTEQEPYKIKATKIGKRPRRRPRRRVTLAKGAPKVFISYRRDDSAGHAGRVHDRLEYEFGRDLLFMDVDSVPLGINFIRVLRDEVAKCDVLLAVIGPNWLTARDDEGNRRLDNPNDFVRTEIATALQRDIPVIPILIDGAKIPKVDQLPMELGELAFRNGLAVRHASFHGDMDKLIAGLMLLGELSHLNTTAT